MIPGIFAGGAAIGGAAGAFPEWLSTTQTVETFATTMSTTLPSVNSGDLLILVVAANTLRTASTPSGFSVLASSLSASSNFARSIFYRVCDGSEGAKVSVTFSGSGQKLAQAIRIKAGTFYAAAPFAIASTTGTTAEPDPPSLSPSWGSAANLWLALGVRSNWNSSPATSWPYADGQATAGSQGHNGASIPRLLSCLEGVVSGSQDPSAWVSGTAAAQWIADTIAIRPA